MMELCIHDNYIVMNYVNGDYDMLMYKHDYLLNYELLLWIMVLEGNYYRWVNALFCLLSEGEFKHYVYVALTCCDMN